MKRILSFVICLALLLSAFPFFGADAAEDEEVIVITIDKNGYIVGGLEYRGECWEIIPGRDERNPFNGNALLLYGGHTFSFTGQASVSEPIVNYGTVISGTFTMAFLNETSGKLENVMLNGTDNKNYGTINSGRFYNVANYGTINGGYFRETTTNYALAVINGGEFVRIINQYRGTVNYAKTSELYNYGNVNGGEYDGMVRNKGKKNEPAYINGGTFTGESALVNGVLDETDTWNNSYITGGTFSAMDDLGLGWINYGVIYGGTFISGGYQYNRIETGRFEGLVRVMRDTSVINGGSFWTINTYYGPNSTVKKVRWAVIGRETVEGKITPELTSAYSGDKVGVTVTPNKGYHLTKLSYYDTDNKEVVLFETGDDDSDITLTVPDRGVKLLAEWIEDYRTLEILNLEAPVAGQVVDYNALVRDQNGNYVDVTSIEYLLFNRSMGKEYVPNIGDEILVRINLKCDGIRRYIGGTTNAKWNGQTAYAMINPQNAEFAVTFHVTPTIPENGVPITTVQITVPEPVVGTPIQNNEYSLSTAMQRYGHFRVTGVGWMTEGHDNMGEAVKAGQSYSVTVHVMANTNYCFGLYETEFLINGEEPTQVYMNRYSQSADLYYLYTPKDIPGNTAERGDVNGDGKVNSADAVYLLRYTMRPTKYPINQNGDMQGDGKVNSADAVYLLRYTMRPSKYPLS